MDRKKTILIAVMVNAGLLVVLFIAALSSPEEGRSPEIATTKVTAMNGPLFSDKIETSVQGQGHPIQEISLPVFEEPKHPPVIHRLPPPEEPKIAVKSEDSKPVAVEVTVKKGDSLAKIAKAHNTTVEEITKNNKLSGSFLKIGQVLKIPAKKSTLSKEAAIPVFQEKSEVAPEYYTVKAGDNPWGIAVKHHMKMEELLKINHLNEEKARKLKPGDRLRIR